MACPEMHKSWRGEAVGEPCPEGKLWGTESPRKGECPAKFCWGSPAAYKAIRRRIGKQETNGSKCLQAREGGGVPPNQAKI